MSAVGLPKQTSSTGAANWSSLSASAFNQNGRLGDAAAPALAQAQAQPVRQQQPAVQQQQQPQLPPALQAAQPIQQQQPAGKATAPSYVFDTLQTYKWTSNKDTNADLDARPLLIGLQHKQLSTNEQANVANLWANSAHNPTRSCSACS